MHNFSPIQFLKLYHMHLWFTGFLVKLSLIIHLDLYEQVDINKLYVCLSYHQKYLLRNQKGLLKSLGMSDSQLITSYVASKLNGYVGGYGSEDQFDKVYK